MEKRRRPSQFEGKALDTMTHSLHIHRRKMKKTVDEQIVKMYLNMRYLQFSSLSMVTKKKPYRRPFTNKIKTLYGPFEKIQT